MFPSPEGGFRALIVDDDELSRDVAASIMRRLGASEVIEAESGPAAIRWADSDHGTLDLVLCDLRMPEVDGLQTLDELARRTYPKLFVLASGADRRTMRAAAASTPRISQGRLRCLDKPVTVDKMQSILGALLAPKAAAEVASFDLLQTVPPECSTDMVRGLPLGQFGAFFAPKLHCATDRIDSAEAVWRWRHPRFGALPPSSFAAVAESVGLLDEVFFSAFRDAVRQCAEWKRRSMAIPISINLPPPLLTSRSLPQRLEEVVRRHGVPTIDVTFEVAETAWLQGRDHAREVLTRLRLRGFGLSIDDFGKEFSTVEVLLDAPFAEMKLDASLLSGSSEDRERDIVLSTYLSLARQLEMTIAFQGVDTPAQRERALRLGCDRIQGAFVGPPLPSEACATGFEAAAWTAVP